MNSVYQFYESLKATGWCVVPEEPTEKMVDAWAEVALRRIAQRLKGDDGPGVVEGARESYKAMIAAAPKLTEAKEPSDE